ncbi:hypothetical protein B0A49_02931 [Cryomyces minteri]|uniref:Uncharacterized protein n=1 Tax=Cryomyces minteri TaxID=331657 RepID=A0A4U0XEM5_9PEZI|nr:hypothetical protein B0A49_02931 [Cryomyces minteri]
MALASYTPVVVKNTTLLGPQISSDLNVYRDGGHSVLINDKIVWLYDDTTCSSDSGQMLSFVSNTAAYSRNPNHNISTLTDFGIQTTGRGNAILDSYSVADGGWVPFTQDEKDFNDRSNGKERVAIWPGTNPTPVSTTSAFIFAPIVYVDSKPGGAPYPTYQARGMTLVSITATATGPQAARDGELIFTASNIAYGGFSCVLGLPSTSLHVASQTETNSDETRDVYLIGMDTHGLQMARVALDDIADYSKYTFFQPRDRTFATRPPVLGTNDTHDIYLPGSYTSGTVFYSPFFGNFLLLYFNHLADSTFYYRYLDLQSPTTSDDIWIKGGKNGRGIQPEDAEALVMYSWSNEARLWTSPTEKGGYNYAGQVHTEFFNRQYYAPSLFPADTTAPQSAWLGASEVPESGDVADGQHLLLSWTAQLGDGLYKVMLARLEFDAIPPTAPAPTATTSSTATATATATSKGPGDGDGYIAEADALVVSGLARLAIGVVLLVSVAVASC